MKLVTAEHIQRVISNIRSQGKLLKLYHLAWKEGSDINKVEEFSKSHDIIQQRYHLQREMEHKIKRIMQNYVTELVEH